MTDQVPPGFDADQTSLWLKQRERLAAFKRRQRFELAKTIAITGFVAITCGAFGGYIGLLYPRQLRGCTTVCCPQPNDDGRVPQLMPPARRIDPVPEAEE